MEPQRRQLLLDHRRVQKGGGAETHLKGTGGDEEGPPSRSEHDDDRGNGPRRQHRPDPAQTAHLDCGGFVDTDDVEKLHRDEQQRETDGEVDGDVPQHRPAEGLGVARGDNVTGVEVTLGVERLIPLGHVSPRIPRHAARAAR